MNNNKKVLQLAFVGGSLESAVGYAHFAAARIDNLWNICAGFFSRDQDQNKQTAKIYGIPASRVYPDVHSLMQGEFERIDAVVILTPTPTHHSIILEIAEYGIPIISEKALCTNVEQAKEIQAAILKHNVYLAVIYNYSGYPMIREARQLIKNGCIGKVLHFQVEMPQEGFLKTDIDGGVKLPQDWRMVDSQIPTVGLDLAVHLHELVHYLTGLDPIEVIADQSSYGFHDVIDNVTCLTRYSGGVQGQFWFSKVAIGQRNGLKVRIFGDRGSIEWLQIEPDNLILSRSDGARVLLDRGSPTEVAHQGRYMRFKPGHPTGFIEALGNLYADLHEEICLMTSGTASNSGEVFGVDLALQGLCWLESMQESIRSNMWEKIGE